MMAIPSSGEHTQRREERCGLSTAGELKSYPSRYSVGLSWMTAQSNFNAKARRKSSKQRGALGRARKAASRLQPATRTHMQRPQKKKKKKALSARVRLPLCGVVGALCCKLQMDKQKTRASSFSLSFLSASKQPKKHFPLLWFWVCFWTPSLPCRAWLV